MKPPQVSIIVPAFNAQAYIGTALESALSQTCSELEVIVVDDGSSDGTADEVRRFAAADSRLRLIRHSSTRGVSVARNTAIAAAQGKWIAPLDADDAFALNRIEYLLSGADETDADLIADNLMLCSFPARQPLEPALRPDSPLFASALTLSVFVAHEDTKGNITLGHLKPLLRRRFIEQNHLAYREDLLVVQDFSLYVDCLLHGARFVLLPEALYLYSIRPGSLSNSGSMKPMFEVARLNRDILASPPIQANAEWRRLFGDRQDLINRTITSAGFAEALKERRIWRALRILARNPHHIPACVNRLSAAAKRRLDDEGFRPRGLKG
jgi:succinoglycan biosynthesis protein ExoO